MLQTGRQTLTAAINGQTVPVQGKETVLQAALRAGIDFPYSCRVGGCGSCKCQLASGQVRELTESGYLLTDSELQQGYILACQSVPLTDVQIAVRLPKTAPRRQVGGKIVAQTRLTHDIVRLDVQLDSPLDYAPGQFAELELASLPGIRRSYSFATAPDTSGRAAFLVRKVPGGVFSTRVVDTDLAGESLLVDGPAGDFWLRPADAPMLLVAGGSGLSAVLAMLQGALEARGDTASQANRAVTLLFGARTQADLYAQDQIAALQRQWQGTFEFVPVLSQEPADSQWQGARGLVTEQIAALLSPSAHAYLCGPPQMVDAAVTVLRGHGVAADLIRADRFLTQHDGPAQAAVAAETATTQRVAGVLDYAKFFLFHAIALLSLVSILAGGLWITAGLLGVLSLYLAGDALSGDDTDTPLYRYPAILTGQLWLSLPLLVAIVFAAVWRVAPGDALGFGAAFQSLTGLNVLAGQATTTFGHQVSLVVLTGLMIGLVGTIPAHELTHRTWDKVSLFVGRWLLAFSLDTIFSIEHVYGHHRYVSTRDDPATAPRGRTVYAHVVISSIRGNISAWHIEAARLRKRQLPVWSHHNVFLRGHLMSLLLLVGAFWLGGLPGGLVFTLSALWGKALLEIVNYMEHYGMVRNPNTPVQPRHSWNTNRRLSSYTMFNLTRHSHHHAQGEAPYHELRPYPQAPMMVGGYLSTIILTLVPPLWFHRMAPKLAQWDRDYATDEERRLLAQAGWRQDADSAGSGPVAAGAVGHA